MDTNRKVFRNSSPAARAELRRVFSRHFDDCSGSLLRFPAQYIEKPEPGGVSQRPVEGRSAIPSIHLLNADGIVELDQLISNLKVEVAPLVVDFLVGFGYQDAGFIPLVGALNSLGEPLLPHGEYIPDVAGEAGISNLHAVGGSKERLQSDIDADRPVDWGQRFEGNILTGEAGEPFTRRGTANCYSLDDALDTTGKPELEGADVPDSQVFAVQLPAGLCESEAVIAVFALETRKARFPVAVGDPPEKSLVSFVQAFKHVLEYLRTNFFIFGERCFKLRKLSFLCKERDSAMIMPISGDALLQGGIVEMSAQRKPPLGFLNSLRVGFNSILERLSSLHGLSIANLRKGGKPWRASPSVSPALKSGGLDGGIL